MPTRRDALKTLSALGIGTLPFQRALADATPKGVSTEMVKQAEWIAGITLTDDDRTLVAAALYRMQAGLAATRAEELPNSLAPALHFVPNPGQAPHVGPRGTVTPPTLTEKPPTSDDGLAFAPITLLAHLLKSKQVTSTELTKLSLARLKKHNPVLKCVVTLTEELALKQAKAADAEIAAGKYRGPLHGIPWGAKDLISVPGYKTTWGAEVFQDQILPETATVFTKLTEAGAVLVAKLALGALAWGDVWFGGQTKNPWNVRLGSSGSSSGPASAVAAGCVPFSIGSETLGSILSPAARCGVTGLRPTFGRVSRAGCMSLAWSMDKLGPLARSVEDCALVLGAIHGADPLDPSSQNRPFRWPGAKPPAELRVGYFEKTTRTETLDALKTLGVKLVPILLPPAASSRAMMAILTAESAAAFDHLTRGGVREGIGAWLVAFREGQFITAVDYLRAQRRRTRLMQEMAKLFETVDLYVGGNDLMIANLTGHPSVALPNGFGNEMPSGITFTGSLFGETELLTVAKAYQEQGGHHLRRPPLK